MTNSCCCSLAGTASCRTCRNNPYADLNPSSIPLFSDGMVLELLILAFANKDEFLRRTDAMFEQYPILKKEYEKTCKAG